MNASPYIWPGRENATGFKSKEENRQVLIPDLCRGAISHPGYRLLDWEIIPYQTRFEIHYKGVVVETEPIGGLTRNRAMDRRTDLIRKVRRLKGAELYLVVPSKYVEQ